MRLHNPIPTCATHRIIIFCGLCEALLAQCTAGADQVSIGPSGINATNLVDAEGNPLDGQGIPVGQVETRRPGKAPPDDTAHISSIVIPFNVFTVNQFPAQTNLTSEHGIHVAGVMIDNSAASGGIVPHANLFSSSLLSAVGGNIPPTNWPLALQAIAKDNGDGGNVWTTNLSIGWVEPDGETFLDGNSFRTQAVDWSARRHDVLYSIARGNDPYAGYPIDAYNGIVVGASEKDATGVFRLVAGMNVAANAKNGRTLTSILAPGINITMPTYDSVPGQSAFAEDSGTSFASPHVAAVATMLQQYAFVQQDLSAPGWQDSAHHHEVIKSVIMNSADKLRDQGNGLLLCMEKDIVELDTSVRPAVERSWLDSIAYADDAIPLSDKLGVGHLNAKRAIKQYESGEWDSNGTAQVPVIGWDYGSVEGLGDFNEYVFNKPWRGGSYVAATVAWDRVVDLNDSNLNGDYDIDESFVSHAHHSIDLYLMSKNSVSVANSVIASVSVLYNVEHIFFQIPQDGEYKIRVQCNEGDGAEFYGLAWWAVPKRECAADINLDEIVGVADLLAVLGSWGLIQCGHPADVSEDGTIGMADLLGVIGGYGHCWPSCCLPNGSCVPNVKPADCAADGGTTKPMGWCSQIGACSPPGCRASHVACPECPDAYTFTYDAPLYVCDPWSCGPSGCDVCEATVSLGEIALTLIGGAGDACSWSSELIELPAEGDCIDADISALADLYCEPCGQGYRWKLKLAYSTSTDKFTGGGYLIFVGPITALSQGCPPTGVYEGEAVPADPPEIPICAGYVPGCIFDYLDSITLSTAE